MFIYLCAFAWLDVSSVPFALGLGRSLLLVDFVLCRSLGHSRAEAIEVIEFQAHIVVLR